LAPTLRVHTRDKNRREYRWSQSGTAMPSAIEAHSRDIVPSPRMLGVRQRKAAECQPMWQVQCIFSNHRESTLTSTKSTLIQMVRTADILKLTLNHMAHVSANNTDESGCADGAACADVLTIMGKWCGARPHLWASEAPRRSRRQGTAWANRGRAAGAL